MVDYYIPRRAEDLRIDPVQYGEMKRNGRVVFKKKEFKVAQKIAKLRQEGHSYQKIADHLNDASLHAQEQKVAC